MRDVRDLFADYATYHQTKGNKVFHRLGIPLIVLSIVGMFAHVKLVTLPMTTPRGALVLDVAMLLIVLAEIYYLRVEWRLALAMLVVLVVFYLAGAAMPFWLNAALFVLGWIFQFIGHIVYEHRQPAFMKNFVHLLVGPLWILNDLLPVVKA